MIVGVLKEIKADENRVAITPAGVEIMSQHGHKVMLEKGAGLPSGFDDRMYRQSGAVISTSPARIFAKADMLLRVKEPQPSEWSYLRPGQIYFAYLHLAASKKLCRALMKARTVNIAYETIQKTDGSLPLLTPMSEVAGPMAIQEGAKYLEMSHGGHGVLLGGVPGVDPGTVLILGGGVVGLNAAKMASGLGAKVYILDIDLNRLRYLSDVMPSNCFLMMSNPANIRELLPKADVVVGAPLIPGSRTPLLVTRNMLKTMKKGAVVIDVSIDQGGCFESSRESTHADPTYCIDGVVHYAVSNMPGALPRTSTLALTNATLPYVLQIADSGWQMAMVENPEVAAGANIVDGKVSHKGLADVHSLKYLSIDALL